MTAPPVAAPPIPRGTVVFVRLDPTEGAEIRKPRPAVVISIDVFNRDTIMVVPLSSKKDREPFPHEVLVRKGDGGIEKDSLAVTHQVRTLSVERVERRLGTISKPVLDRIVATVMVITGAWDPARIK